MTNTPLILLTNDDGIESPGLWAAIEAVAPLGDLLIVAPHRQQSASGRSFAPMRDKTIYKISRTVANRTITAHSLNGTPAQTVVTALLDMAHRPVDLAISGINFGENIGSGITTSGTVGAALEAASSGVPAMAVSLQTPPEYYFSHSTAIDFSAAAHFTRLFAEKILRGGLPFDVDVLKIDVPATATPATAWRITSVSRQLYHTGVPSTPEKRGQEVETGYQINFDAEKIEPHSDIWAVAIDKIVSVSPVSVDLTSRIALDDLHRHLNGHQS